MSSSRELSHAAGSALDARAFCQAFANRHKVVFQDAGTCGFGRPCVGLLRGGNYIDYDPIRSGGDYSPIPDLECAACRPPQGVNAYHKHDCFAVLYDGDEDGREEAIIQLARWIENMEAHGTPRLVEYPTGATGIQALVSGAFGHCFVVAKADASGTGPLEGRTGQLREDQ